MNILTGFNLREVIPLHVQFAGLKGLKRAVISHVCIMHILFVVLKVFDCVASHEVHHREASLVEESKGFGTRHVLIYQG